MAENRRWYVEEGNPVLILYLRNRKDDEVMIAARWTGKDMYEFKLENNEFIELNRLLKFVGLCESGGMSKAEISSGQVMVDGQVERRKRCKIRSGQIVEFQGNKILVS